MKRKQDYLKLAVLFLLFATVVSCGKDGAEGPLGPVGQQGEKGDQGAKGTDGTLLRYGNGVPAASLGNENDFYIDIKNSNLYGPKTGNSWGTPTSLKGPAGATGTKGEKGDAGARGATGAAGAAGSQFLSGTAVPTTQGKVSDFYFRTTTGVLYGPKTASGWGSGVSLKGAKGDKGDKGDRGSDGNADVKSYSFEIAANEWERSAWAGIDNVGWNRYFVNGSKTGGDLRHDNEYVSFAYIETYFDGKSFARSKGHLPLRETFATYAINFELDLKNAWVLMSKTTNGVNQLEVPLGQRPDKVIVRIVRVKVENVNSLQGKLDFKDYQAVSNHFNLRSY